MGLSVIKSNKSKQDQAINNMILYNVMTIMNDWMTSLYRYTNEYINANVHNFSIYLAKLIWINYMFYFMFYIAGRAKM